MKEKSTYGLSTERLARLLAIGLQGSDTRDSLHACRTSTEVLKEMLAGKLPLDPAMPDSLPALLNRPCDELLTAADRTMGDLLLDSRTDLALIKALKDYGRELRCRDEPKSKQTAATVIYYAAIASGLVFHRHKMIQHSYGKLQEAYVDLGQKDWIPSDLKDLFRKAHVLCQQQKGKAE